MWRTRDQDRPRALEKKQMAAGFRPSGAALAEERLQCAPDRMVTCFRVRCRLGRRHGAEQVLRPRRGAKEEQQPGTLQVRQLWQLCQQALLLLQALPRARGNVLWGADGRAEGNKPKRAFCLGWRQPRQVPLRQKKPLRVRRARDWVQESSEKLSRPGKPQAPRAAQGQTGRDPTRRPAHSHRPVGCGGRRRHRPTTSTPIAAHRRRGQRVQAKASLPRVRRGKQPGCGVELGGSAKQSGQAIRPSSRLQCELVRPGGLIEEARIAPGERAGDQATKGVASGNAPHSELGRALRVWALGHPRWLASLPPRRTAQAWPHRPAGFCSGQPWRRTGPPPCPLWPCGGRPLRRRHRAG